MESSRKWIGIKNSNGMYSNCLIYKFYVGAGYGYLSESSVIF